MNLDIPTKRMFLDKFVSKIYVDFNQDKFDHHVKVEYTGKINGKSFIEFDMKSIKTDHQQTYSR